MHHFPLNQWPLKYAPYPIDTALSVCNSNAILGSHLGDMKRLRPFHDFMKLFHQVRSWVKESVRDIVVSNKTMEADRSMILRRKVRPGATTLAANERRPINESRSRFVVTDFETQDEMASLICANLSGGSRASRFTVSKSIPRNGSWVDGPLSLSSAMGMY